MRQPSERVRLAQQPRASLRVVARAQELDRDLAAERGIEGGMHDALAAAAQAAEHPVATDEQRRAGRREQRAPHVVERLVAIDRIDRAGGGVRQPRPQVVVVGPRHPRRTPP